MFPVPPNPMPATSVCFCGCVSRDRKTALPFPETLPADALWKVLEYTPRSALILAVVSRGLSRSIGEGMKISMTEIFAQCSTGNGILCRSIQRLKVDHEMRLSSSAVAGGLFLLDAETRSSMIAHRALVHQIRVLGVKVSRDEILISQGVASNCDEVQRLQNDSLQRSRGGLRRAIMEANYWYSEFPEDNAAVETVRAWMLNPANSHALEPVTTLNLDNLDLECVPVEMFALTQLGYLNLSRNRLAFLEAGVFRDFSALQTLRLSGNQLTSLDAGVFQGLPALTGLDLSHNRLLYLKAQVFQGLEALQQLDLDDNRLISLEVGAFGGLRAMQKLYLFNNRLTSLEVGIFQGLTALQELYLYQNQLTSLEVGVFLGLPALEKIYGPRQMDPVRAREIEAAAAQYGSRFRFID